ncbi:histidine kinase [Burkholderia sp. WAC0059]|nr:histidine kinase [Burkholderia sp. WAC0059]
MLDSQPWGTIALDAAGAVLAASARAADLLQRALPAGIGLTGLLADLVAPDALARDALLGGVEVAVDGAALWLKGEAPGRGANGGHAGNGDNSGEGGVDLVVSVVDITPLREALDTRTSSLRFLMHDLRSPLNSIVALTQLNENDREAFDRCGGMEQISQLARYVLSLGEQFIFSSVAEHLQKQDFKRFELRSTVRQMIPQLEVSAVYCNVSLQLWLSDGTAVWVNGMRNFVARALQNVIDNAIHASRPGTAVEVSLKTVDGYADIRISDRAGGLPGLHEKGIVTDFESLGKKTASGFGIGLKLAKQIVELHGGTMHAESNQGEGTTFVLRFPRLGGTAARSKTVSFADLERMLGGGGGGPPE